MESITIKVEKTFSQEIESAMKKYNYSTKTELIREALRDKLSDLEKKDILHALDLLVGSSKKKSRDEDIHSIRKRVFEELEKEFTPKKHH